MVGSGIGVAGDNGVNVVDVAWLFSVAALIALVGPTSQEIAREHVVSKPALAALGALAMAAVFLQVGGGTNAEFIYFQF
jgi:hypothetical protein